MPSKAKLPNLADLRVGREGSTGSFEEFCCQLFRRAPEAPRKGRYRRIRGAGGDGGVEAVWSSPAGDTWGIQAKFFSKLEPAEKAQIAESIRQAAANYPGLEHYTICLPFVLTGKKGAAPKRSKAPKTGKARKPAAGQHETFAKWVAEWEAALAKSGRVVEIDLWDESELIARLAAADTTGGLARYWFDQEAFTPAWFEERLRDAVAQAGPRYSPEFAVATPLDDALHAFGRSELWAKRLGELAKRFFDKVDWWRGTAGGRIEPLSAIPEDLTAEAKALLEAVEALENSLDAAVEGPETLTEPAFREGVRRAAGLADALEPPLKAALLRKHGENADSAGFRQFHAEYMANFPMASLDHLRRLRSVLAEVEALAFQPEGQLPASAAMLIRGEAGIGKTHGIVDAAVRRNESGLRSVVVFGEDIAGPDPWNGVVAKLGLGSAIGRDAVLNALDAAGEASGFPLVIFIDALNETQPDRRQWQSWLPPMLEQIKRRSSLKLCVSCRDTYLREVMPAALLLPEVVHNGFLGREYEAQSAFMRHFKLGAPAEPLLQEEFSNPLFLRLVCSAVAENGERAIPAGREGLQFVINRLLRAKNDKAAQVCNFDRRENRVGEAVKRLAGEMASTHERYVPLDRAKQLVDGTPTAYTQSLLAVIENESLIAVVEKPPTTRGGDSFYTVRFTFERVGDHLVAEHLLAQAGDLKGAFVKGGSLAFLSGSNEAAARNSGLLEALSILLPETHGEELLDVLKGIDRALLWGPFLRGLQWRSPDHIYYRTRAFVREALGANDTAKAALDAVLGLAPRPGHPLNAEYLHQMLAPISMLTRDPFWANMLEASYSRWSDTVDPKSAVHRLIDSARRGHLADLPDEVGVLWTTALAWFCASPDRRIRDRATMAMVSVFRARPAVIAPLLQRFADSEDEYISERVLAAAYGALLLRPSAPDLQAAATEIYGLYFRDGAPPLNASLRDHGRLLIELAIDLGVAPRNLKKKRCRPPYESRWPLHLPGEKGLRKYANDRKRFPQMNLVQEMGLATGTDFARYVVEPCVTDGFDIKKAGLDKLSLFRWFLKQAVDLGYPGKDDQCAMFDRALLAEFGGGRGKPGWAERLGKKYYWIFLRRLVGIMGDHADRKTWTGTFPPSGEPQGLALRDIDPSDLRQFQERDIVEDAWLTPSPYVFGGPDNVEGDAAWVAQDDLPQIADALILTSPDGTEWHALDMPMSWRGVRADRRVDSYRYAQQNMQAFSCASKEIARVKKAFAAGTLHFLASGPHDYQGYLGEYPRRVPYRQRKFDPITFDQNEGGVDFRYLEIRQLRGREWERDYSQLGESSSLLMPSPDLIAMGNLVWDGCGGWLDVSGTKQAMDPWWWFDGKGPGLVVRLDYLDFFLAARKEALVLLGFQTKFIAGMTTGPGRLTERTLFIRSRGKTWAAQRKLESD